jgi:hypothetical protein
MASPRELLTFSISRQQFLLSRRFLPRLLLRGGSYLLSEKTDSHSSGCNEKVYAPATAVIWDPIGSTKAWW